MFESPEQSRKEASAANDEYSKAITASTAKLMKEAGFSVIHIDTIKVAIYFLGTIGVLTGIVYATLLSADASQRERITKIEDVASSIQNMAGNIYNLCLSDPGAKCVNPEGPLK